MPHTAFLARNRAGGLCFSKNSSATCSRAFLGMPLGSAIMRAYSLRSVERRSLHANVRCKWSMHVQPISLCMLTTRLHQSSTAGKPAIFCPQKLWNAVLAVAAGVQPGKSDFLKVSEGQSRGKGEPRCMSIEMPIVTESGAARALHMGLHMGHINRIG